VPGIALQSSVHFLPTRTFILGSIRAFFSRGRWVRRAR
jgi:hypothetical protein